MSTIKKKIDNGTTKIKLLETAIELFSTKGYHATSIRDIAKEMNMSISNMYYYYGNKGALLHAIEQKAIIPMMEELLKVSKLDLPPLDRFTLLFKTHLTFIGKNLRETRIFLLNRESAPQENNYISRNAQQEVLSIYRKELDKLSMIGYTIRQSHTICCLNIFGILNWFQLWYRPKGSLSLEQVVNQVTEFVLYGLIGGSNSTGQCTSEKAED